MLLRCAARPMVSTMMRSQAVTTRYAARALSTAGKETYTDKQAKTGRPISPHVSIYAFPIAALSSITNRVSGCVLTGGVSGIAVMALVGGNPAGLLTAIGSSFAGPAAKVWDNYPDLLYTKGVTEASWVLVGSSAFLSLAAGAVVLDAAPEKEAAKKK